MRVTFDEWHNHSQVGREVQQQVKPRDDSELRGEDERLPPQRVKALEKAASGNATTSVGMDLHPDDPLDMSDA